MKAQRVVRNLIARLAAGIAKLIWEIGGILGAK